LTLPVDRLGQAAQARAGGGEVLDPAHQASRVPAEAVQPRGDYDISRAQTGQQGIQLWLPVMLPRIGPFLDDLLASCLGQRLALRGVVGLIASMRAEVADQHGEVPPNTTKSGSAP